YNPFFVAAKRWGNSFHTLVYVSPLLEHDFSKNSLVLNWQINTSFHYVIPQTKHFIGVEFNKEINNEKLEMTIRPQIKMKLTTKLAIGIITGIPINKHNESCSSFLRIIYEL
ncbi:MAG: HAEPLYID family protein, partial [Bacteroidia bacterium]